MKVLFFLTILGLYGCAPKEIRTCSNYCKHGMLKYSSITGCVCFIPSKHCGEKNEEANR